MQSQSICLNTIRLPLIEEEYSMIPFDLQSLEGLPERFKQTAKDMVKTIAGLTGTAFFTIHGKRLMAGETLRRPGPHTDGNYEAYNMTFGGGGWKVGEDGPGINTALHHRQYVKATGGIILASNYESCLGWNGEYNGLPNTGGDCSHIALGEPFLLNKDKVYYGNNHFIHESLPVLERVHRVMARITLPEDHVFSTPSAKREEA